MCTWHFPWKNFLICMAGQQDMGGDESKQKAIAQVEDPEIRVCGYRYV